VEENLRVARLTVPKGWSLDRIWEVFLHLSERRTSRGRTLSGGEQNVAEVLSFAQRVYGFNNRHVVYEGSAADLRADPAPMRAFMGLTA
jgi:branched-chain amino acid transport system ATP-binding protein